LKFEGKGFYVRGMFDKISLRYDLMNKVMSLGFDNVWRRKAAQLCSVSSGSLCLDVCTGSGMLALELAKIVKPGGRVYALDFSRRMLQVARSRLDGGSYTGLIVLVEGDALNLPFKDDVFDCVTMAFCLRNVEDLVVALREMVRVTRPGGRVVVLDLSKPANRFLRRLNDVYLKAVVPVLGSIIVGEKDPYAYMYTSLLDFPVRWELARIMSSLGLRNVRFYEFNLGMVAVHVGVKGAPSL
jgi:demethylmenaquinone methyltransferase/2-methoxy-6-polyprenyl-1,4-benzoquinol methylase